MESLKGTNGSFPANGLTRNSTISTDHRFVKPSYWSTITLKPANGKVHRSHIRTALMTPFSMRSIRKVIQREGLISTEGLSTLKMDFKCFRDTGHLREAQPTRYLQPQASSHPDTEADVPEDLSVTSDQIDEILNELPIEFFMYHEPPRTGETWTCPYEGCRDTIPSNPGYSGAGEFDAVIVTLRSRISKHLWEEHVPKDLSQDSLGKLASYLAHVES